MAILRYNKGKQDIVIYLALFISSRNRTKIYSEGIKIDQIFCICQLENSDHLYGKRVGKIVFLESVFMKIFYNQKKNALLKVPFS